MYIRFHSIIRTHISHRKEESLARSAKESMGPIAFDHDKKIMAKRQSEAHRIQTRARTAFERWDLCAKRVLDIEDELGIVDRWQTSSPEYLAAARDHSERRYLIALDNLERLVVQRMLELTRLGMSGIGASIDIPVLM